MIDLNEAASAATVHGRSARAETGKRNARNDTHRSASGRDTNGDRFGQEIAAIEIKETSILLLFSRQQIANWPVVLISSHHVIHLTRNCGRLSGRMSCHHRNNEP